MCSIICIYIHVPTSAFIYSLLLSADCVSLVNGTKIVDGELIHMPHMLNLMKKQIQSKIFSPPHDLNYGPWWFSWEVLCHIMKVFFS